MYEPLEATKYHNSLKLSILVPVKANFLYILQYDTPCTILKMNRIKKDFDSFNDPNCYYPYCLLSMIQGFLYPN